MKAIDEATKTIQDVERLSNKLGVSWKEVDSVLKQNNITWDAQTKRWRDGDKKFTRIDDIVEKFTPKVKDMNKELLNSATSMKNVLGIALPLMFSFQAVSQTMKSVLEPARDLVGVTDLYQQFLAIKYLPTALDELDSILALGDAWMDMSEDEQRVAGATVKMGDATSQLISFLAQAAMTGGAFGDVIPIIGRAAGTIAGIGTAAGVAAGVLSTEEGRIMASLTGIGTAATIMGSDVVGAMEGMVDTAVQGMVDTGLGNIEDDFNEAEVEISSSGKDAGKYFIEYLTKELETTDNLDVAIRNVKNKFKWTDAEVKEALESSPEYKQQALEIEKTTGGAGVTNILSGTPTEMSRLQDELMKNSGNVYKTLESLSSKSDETFMGLSRSAWEYNAMIQAGVPGLVATRNEFNEIAMAASKLSGAGLFDAVKNLSGKITIVESKQNVESPIGYEELIALKKSMSGASALGVDLNDFLVSGGKVHQINPQDTIMGVKDTSGMSSQVINYSPSINISEVVIKEDADYDTFKRRIEEDTVEQLKSLIRR